jgi:disulfide bond formation protein DsbB
MRGRPRGARFMRMDVAALTSRVQRSALHPLFPAAAITGLGVALIAGALAFEHLGGLKPCPLCLEQRTPWYILIVLGFAILGAERLKAPRAALLALYAVAALVAAWSVTLGGFHAGVEYKWWPGPADCTGDAISLPSDGGLLGGLSPDEIVRCDEVPWDLFGVSLAGFNFLFSLVAVALASFGALGAFKEKR